MPILASLLTLSALLRPFHAWASTPPMGWNSWDCFGTGVTEAQTRDSAAYMAANLKQHGYRLITVDIDWFVPGARGFNYTPNVEIAMDGYGRPLPAADRFPSAAGGQGFKPLADWTHRQGLKFGVHLLRGIPRKAVERNLPILGTPFHAADVANKADVCPWNPDMYGVDMSKPGAQAWYDSLFALLAKWGIDFVKVDDLSRPYHQPEIEAIRKAIDKTHRPIVFSTSPGATPLESGPHVETHANMWRVSDDFWDNWDALKEQFERLDRWTPFRGVGHWPDADMIPLGAVRVGQRDEGSHFTATEGQTLMTLWSIARSPLILGGHLPKTDPTTLSLITNDEVLTVNRASTNNRQLWRKGDQVAWVADVPNSRDKYLALFNAADQYRRDDSRAAFRADVTRNTPDQSVTVDVDTKDSKRIWLVADDAGDGNFADHVVWADPTVATPSGDVRVEKWASATQGYGQTRLNRNAIGQPLVLNGQPIAHGIGSHAPSVIAVDLPEGATRFQARVGLEGEGARLNGGGTLKILVFTQDPTVGDSRPAVPVPFDLAALGLGNKVAVRDLWAHRSLGVQENVFSPSLPWHGAGLYRVSPTKRR
jgi:hypothetical protein